MPDKNYWDVIWSRPYVKYEGFQWPLWYLARLHATGRVADLGCGSSSCWRGVKTLDIWGIDYSKEAIIQSKKNCPQGHFKVADIFDTHLREHYFDTVCLLGVVHYYKNLSRLVKEIDRIAKKKARILITIVVEIDKFDECWDRNRIIKTFGSLGEIETEYLPGYGWFVKIEKNG